MIATEDAPPEGFVELRHDGARLLVRPEARSWAESAVSGHGTLHRAAARESGGRSVEGRDPVYLVEARPDEVEAVLDADPGRWAVRHYRRGGAVAPLLGDRYLRVGEPRPFLELRASEVARSRRIPTPRVIAAAVYPAGPFYRGDLVTKYVENAVQLARVLFDPDRRGLAATVDRRQALAETGALIRRMAAAGLHHPDLNARNVLLQWKGQAPDAWVVDLDRCRFEPDPVEGAADAMEARLVRSIRKLEKKSDLPAVPEGDLRTLSRAVDG